MQTYPLWTHEKKMGNIFDELLQMAIGEPNDNFIPPEEVDFHGMRESSCEEFSG